MFSLKSLETLSKCSYILNEYKSCNQSLSNNKQACQEVKSQYYNCINYHKTIQNQQINKSTNQQINQPINPKSKV